METIVSLSSRESPSDLANLKKIVREIGLKVTQQRLFILETILKGRDHVTAQELYESVARRAPDIGFATIYRFLRTLCQHNYMTEVRMGGLPARYEWANKKHHDHLTCVRCRRICEFENQEIENLQIKIATQMGFVLTNHVLEMFGLCTDCQDVKKQ